MVEGTCPDAGIKYGFYGNTHPDTEPKKDAAKKKEPEPAPVKEKTPVEKKEKKEKDE